MLNAFVAAGLLTRYSVGSIIYVSISHLQLRTILSF